MKRKRKRLLPKVNPEVGYSISAGFKEGDEAYYGKMMSLIRKENPVIAEFIERWADRTEPDYALHSAFSGIFVYALLRGQAEANEMKRTIRL